MREGLKLIDADCHLIEPFELWSSLPEPYTGRGPRWKARHFDETLAERVERLGPRALLPLPPVAEFEGQPVMARLSEEALFVLAEAALARAPRTIGLDKPANYLAALDTFGIDACALHPTWTGLLLSRQDVEPGLLAAIAEAYNRWLLSFCSADPHRLLAVGVVNLHAPLALAEAVHGLADRGVRALALRPNPVRGRSLGDAGYADFWAACAEREISIAFHGSSHGHDPTAGADRFESRFGQHSCAHPMELMMAFVALLEGGVLERHPTLRVAFLEAGAGWVPYWLWRLDDQYRQLSREVRAIRQMPSAYFRRQCFVGAEPDEPNLMEIINAVGEGRVLAGTDFPHLDHSADGFGPWLERRTILGIERTRRILADNATEFYGIGARAARSPW